MDTNVKQNIEITGYTPDFNSKKLKVMVYNLELEKEIQQEVSFSDIAREFDPESEGRCVNVILTYTGVCPDSGPFSEPYDFPLSPAAFISEMLDQTTDKALDPEVRKPYVAAFDNSLIKILERRELQWS